MRDGRRREGWGSRDLRVPVPEGSASFDLDVGHLRFRLIDLPTAPEPFVHEQYAPHAMPVDETTSPDLVLRCALGRAETLAAPAAGETLRLEIVRRGDRLAIRSHFQAAEIDLARGEGSLVLTDRTWDRFAYSLENVLRVATQALASPRQMLLLHAAVVIDAGRAIVLAGPSGGGKTTAVRLAGARRALSDDLALIDLAQDPPAAVAVPFHPVASPQDRLRGAFPVRAVLRLRASDDDALEPLPPARAAASVLACVPYAADLQLPAARLAALAGVLVNRAPVLMARFTLSGSLWDLVSSRL